MALPRRRTVRLARVAGNLAGTRERSRDPWDEPVGGAERVRLQKVLARAGVASRRQAEDMIVDGRVTVNGKVVQQLGARVSPDVDTIHVDGVKISLTEQQSYLALNKPAGYVSTASDPEGRPMVMDLVPPIPGLFPIGRLDTSSEGLILLTTDGEWGQRVSHPRFGCTKEYVAEVRGRVRPSVLATLRRPMQLDEGEWTTGAEVDVQSTAVDRTLLRIVLYEGRNRQIRRMMEIAGHPVEKLVRVRVGAVQLGTLRPGEWRHLTHDEIAATVSDGAHAAPTSDRAARRRLA